MERTFGHYARVLVDIDVSIDLKYEVLVERKDFAFFVEFEYENLPEFCSYCKMIGHNVAVCRKANKQKEAYKGKAQVTDKGKEMAKHQQKEQAQKKQWSQKEPAVVDLVNEDTNKFAALQNEDNNAPDGKNEPADVTNLINNMAESPTPAENSADSRGYTKRNLEIHQLEQVSESDIDDDNSQSEFVDAT